MSIQTPNDARNAARKVRLAALESKFEAVNSEIVKAIQEGRKEVVLWTTYERNCGITQKTREALERAGWKVSLQEQAAPSDPYRACLIVDLEPVLLEHSDFGEPEHDALLVQTTSQAADGMKACGEKDFGCCYDE